MKYIGFEENSLRIGRVYFDFRQQWSEWFVGKWNWRNFTFIELSYEDESNMGGIEILVALMGLRVRIYWIVNPDAEMRQEIMRRHDDLLEQLGLKDQD